MIPSMWRNAKLWRTVSLGPVSIIYRMGRTARVSSNSRRALVNAIRSFRSGSRNNNQHGPIPTAISAGNGLVSKDLPDRRETGLIVGVGPGLGFSLARKLASSGMGVALVSRNAERLDAFAEELRCATGAAVFAYGCDATDEISVKKVIDLISKDLGVPDLVIYSIQASSRGRAIDIEVPSFEECWRQNCLGAFIIAREAARRMSALHRATIVLIGSTSGMIGRSEHLNLAVGKFGLRALAQVLARELWPCGIHVVHLVIDAEIREDESTDLNSPQAYPEHISDLLYDLHRQPKSAWTSELDVRPWNEKFWEHC